MMSKMDGSNKKAKYAIHRKGMNERINRSTVLYSENQNKNIQHQKRVLLSRTTNIEEI